MFETRPKLMNKPCLTLALLSISVFFAAGCNSRRSESRDQQLEETAESLEAKADQVRRDVKQSADEKVAEAKKALETTGDKETAVVFEKDASVTREVGAMRAKQLEDQAEKVREQKE